MRGETGRPSGRGRAGPWRVVLVAMACAGVSQAFGRFTYSLLLTDVRDDLGVSNTVAGSLGSANLAAYLVGTLAVSVAVGRLGLSRTTRVGVIGVTGGLLLLAWGPRLPIVFLGMAVTGLFGSAVWVTAPGLATAALGPTRRGTAIGIVGAGIGLGIVSASVVGATVASDSWRTVYGVEAAVGVVVCVFALATLRGGAPVTIGVAGLSAIRLIPHWRPLLWAYGLFAMGLAVFLTFMVAVLEEDAGWSSSAAAFAFTALGVGTVVGGPLFGPMSDRLGRPAVLVIAFTVMAVTAVMVPTGARPWAVLAAFAFGAAFTGVPTTIAALVSDHVAAESFGAAFGVATLAFGVGLSVGPQLGGLLSDVTGSFRPVFAVAVACALTGAFLSARLRRPVPRPSGTPAGAASHGDA